MNAQIGSLAVGTSSTHRPPQTTITPSHSQANILEKFLVEKILNGDLKPSLDKLIMVDSAVTKLAYQLSNTSKDGDLNSRISEIFSANFCCTDSLTKTTDHEISIPIRFYLIESLANSRIPILNQLAVHRWIDLLYLLPTPAKKSLLNTEEVLKLGEKLFFILLPKDLGDACQILYYLTNQPSFPIEKSINYFVYLHHHIPLSLHPADGKTQETITSLLENILHHENFSSEKNDGFKEALMYVLDILLTHNQLSERTMLLDLARQLNVLSETDRCISQIKNEVVCNDFSAEKIPAIIEFFRAHQVIDFGLVALIVDKFKQNKIDWFVKALLIKTITEVILKTPIIPSEIYKLLGNPKILASFEWLFEGCKEKEMVYEEIYKQCHLHLKSFVVDERYSVTFLNFFWKNLIFNRLIHCYHNQKLSDLNFSLNYFYKNCHHIHSSFTDELHLFALINKIIFSIYKLDNSSENLEENLDVYHSFIENRFEDKSFPKRYHLLVYENLKLELVKNKSSELYRLILNFLDRLLAGSFLTPAEKIKLFKDILFNGPLNKDGHFPDEIQNKIDYLFHKYQDLYVSFPEELWESFYYIYATEPLISTKKSDEPFNQYLGLTSLIRTLVDSSYPVQNLIRATLFLNDVQDSIFEEHFSDLFICYSKLMEATKVTLTKSPKNVEANLHLMNLLLDGIRKAFIISEGKLTDRLEIEAALSLIEKFCDLLFFLDSLDFFNDNYDSLIIYIQNILIALFRFRAKTSPKIGATHSEVSIQLLYNLLNSTISAPTNLREDSEKARCLCDLIIYAANCKSVLLKTLDLSSPPLNKVFSFYEDLKKEAEQALGCLKAKKASPLKNKKKSDRINKILKSHLYGDRKLKEKDTSYLRSSIELLKKHEIASYYYWNPLISKVSICHDQELKNDTWNLLINLINTNSIQPSELTEFAGLFIKALPAIAPNDVAVIKFYINQLESGFLKKCFQAKKSHIDLESFFVMLFDKFYTILTNSPKSRKTALIALWCKFFSLAINDLKENLDFSSKIKKHLEQFLNWCIASPLNDKAISKIVFLLKDIRSEKLFLINYFHFIEIFFKFSSPKVLDEAIEWLSGALHLFVGHYSFLPVDQFEAKTDFVLPSLTKIVPNLTPVGLALVHHIIKTGSLEKNFPNQELAISNLYLMTLHHILFKEKEAPKALKIYFESFNNTLSCPPKKIQRSAQLAIKVCMKFLENRPLKMIERRICQDMGSLFLGLTKNPPKLADPIVSFIRSLLNEKDDNRVKKIFFHGLACKLLNSYLLSSQSSVPTTTEFINQCLQPVLTLENLLPRKNIKKSIQLLITAYKTQTYEQKEGEHSLLNRVFQLLTNENIRKAFDEKPEGYFQLIHEMLQACDHHLDEEILKSSSVLFCPHQTMQMNPKARKRRVDAYLLWLEQIHPIYHLLFHRTPMELIGGNSVYYEIFNGFIDLEIKAQEYLIIIMGNYSKKAKKQLVEDEGSLKKD